jgi:hypothetical protein
MNENDCLVLAEMILDLTAAKSSNVQASGRQIQMFIQMFRIIAKPVKKLQSSSQFNL